MPVDAVRYEYGSVVHDTLRFLLQLAGIPRAIVGLVLMTTTIATVHKGGYAAVYEALAGLLASVAQGCPLPVMVFFGGAERRAFPALLRVPPWSRTGGTFDRLGYMDDTTSCMDCDEELLVCADNLQWAGLQTNPF